MNLLEWIPYFAQFSPQCGPQIADRFSNVLTATTLSTSTAQGLPDSSAWCVCIRWHFADACLALQTDGGGIEEFLTCADNICVHETYEDMIRLNFFTEKWDQSTWQSNSWKHVTLSPNWGIWAHGGPSGAFCRSRAKSWTRRGNERKTVHRDVGGSSRGWRRY